MDYSKYKKSRNLSWQILKEHRVSELPIKVSAICNSMQIKIISYQTGHNVIKSLKLQSNTQHSDGFTYNRTIFYNNACSVARQRFTVAHELGHILLHGGKNLYNREPEVNDNPIEQEANVFASRLLAPACVLWGLGVTTPQQISDFCNISIHSATFRMKRINELYLRENIFLEKRGKSCFLLSPLERSVYNQFFEYINKYKL